MMELFYNLQNIPCWNCKYYYSYTSRCVKRQSTHPSELYPCPKMDIDLDIVQSIIIDYTKNQ